MAIVYRPVAADELGEAANVFLTALADLARRNGLPPPTAFTPANVGPLFAHLRATGAFRAAIVDGRLGAICAAVVRDDQWFLSMFWALPELQRRGVGAGLLREVFDEGRAQGAAHAFTWSSIDPAAMATYMKLGLLPACQIFTFAGRPRPAPAAEPGFDLEPLEAATADRFDRELRGASRAVDHAYWSARGVPGWQVRRRGDVVGYFRAGGGAIGPAGWAAPECGAPVLALALDQARLQAPEVRLAAIGVNHVAIRTALGAGLQLVSTAHLLQSAPAGRPEQYVPSGPALF